MVDLIEDIGKWVAASPYCRGLGVVCESTSKERCVLALPYREANANMGGVLHGGVAASLCAAAAAAVARGSLGNASGPLYASALHINYLSAVTKGEIVAEGRLLRSGRDLCYAAIDIRSRSCEFIANATALVRARFGAEPGRMPGTTIHLPPAGPAPMAERMARNAFVAARGMRMTYQDGGMCGFEMRWQDSNADSDGGLHAGAALSLLDTAGAMACFTCTGFKAKRASTPSIQAQILAPLPAVDVEARASVIHRDGDLFWCDAEITPARRNEVLVRGTVIYRIIPAE